MFRILELLLVLAAGAWAFYLVSTVLARRRSGPQALGPGTFRTHHYDVKGVTRVVVQKLSPGGTNILDEHLVATIKRDDPSYDTAFMTAMSTARERRALFEAEADD